MRIYNYHPVTKAYISSATADLSPMDKKEDAVFLVPAYATNVAPPKAKKNTIPVFNPETNVWSLVTDRRGIYFKEDGSELMINELGEELPEGVVLTSTPPPENTKDIVLKDGEWKEDNEKVKTRRVAEERDKRDRLLVQADNLIHKAEDDGSDAAALRTYRQALRDVPQQSGFPNTIAWPTKPS